VFQVLVGNCGNDLRINLLARLIPNLIPKGGVVHDNAVMKHTDTIAYNWLVVFETICDQTTMAKNNIQSTIGLTP
jgi:hypothetical protein